MTDLKFTLNKKNAAKPLGSKTRRRSFIILIYYEKQKKYVPFFSIIQDAEGEGRPVPSEARKKRM